ncbi:hypothetical protein CTA1_119 [Colletotrichum tanaceti]|uniref:DUF6604 domain-containing protein n=1 Tax=Colletotrichum tanaceti TaxID=1306861 RepID=A0A4V6DG66_9PEZI|nr:hypothetical protein CTA1_119 [Colletotrichum tanaceti]
MTRLIGQEMRSIPAVVVKVLRSVILARIAHWDGFQQYTESSPELENSHAADRTFTIALYKAFGAFEALCVEDVRNANQEWPCGAQTCDALEEIVSANDFSVRDIRMLDDEGSDYNSSNAISASQSHGRKRRNMGNRKKRKKKAKIAEQGAAALGKVPLEEYRFLRTDEELTTEYTMAVCSYFLECACLRAYLQGIWHEVAYDGLNSVVAGALVQLAFGVAKQTESEVFADFPGKVSYETLERLITRGNSQKAEKEFSAAMHALVPDDQSQGSAEAFIDLKDYMLADAYRNLVDFIADYQKNRNGFPTMRMLMHTTPWDPGFDLQQATKEERLEWRRMYTINWLYDLVNHYSSPILEQPPGGQNLEDIDWSTGNQCLAPKAISGLQDFGAVITSLAMQKPGTQVAGHISPFEVIVLQCIIDAFTVSRGWSVDMLKGHVIIAPPQSFDPTREIKMFLRGKNESGDSGCLKSLDTLYRIFEASEEFPKEPEHRQGWLRAIRQFYNSLMLLGDSNQVRTYHSFPSSNFAATHVNGLWELSPLLCAVSLKNYVELAYRYAMALWDALASITSMVHLYNMLVEKGYVTMPNQLHHSLRSTFRDSFFLNGEVPTYDFAPVLSKRLQDRWDPRLQALKQSQCDDAYKVGGPQNALHLSLLLAFRKRANLLVYGEVGWNIEMIPDDVIEPQSSLAMLRISQTKRVVDPQTGKKTFDDTDLIRRTRGEFKVDDDELFAIANAHMMGRPDSQSNSQLTGE